MRVESVEVSSLLALGVLGGADTRLAKGHPDAFVPVRELEVTGGPLL